MLRFACLFLLGLAACFPSDQEVTKLADLPDLTITFQASSAQVWAEISYRTDELGTCAILDDSFRATLGETAMEIANPGSKSDPGCNWPQVLLDAPPAVDSLVLADDSKQVTIPLEGRLAHLLPEQPWIAEAGSTMQVRYEPPGALRETRTKLVLDFPVQVAEGQWTDEVVSFTATSEQLTFTVPDHPGSWHLSLWGFARPTPMAVPCEGALCRVVAQNTPPLEVPIEIRSPARPVALASAR